ncbi:hypothetical protein GCM10009081_22370 [Brevundimonas nasdae]
MGSGARSEAVSPPHRMKSDRRKRQRGRQAIARRQAGSGPSWSGRQAVAGSCSMTRASEAAEAEGQDGEIERRSPASDPSTGKGLTPHPSSGDVGLVILCDLAFKG